MKILALDSSGMVASAAIIEDDVLIGEYSINHKKTHSQTLLPMLDEVVKMTETDLEDVDAIALAKGPGSFTGLRIGSATAKGLGLALNKPIVAVPTLDAIAYNLYHAEGYICPIIDARRNHVYTGIYAWNGDEFDFENPVIFLGDGVAVHREHILETCTVPVSFAPAHLNRQRAGAVGSLGMEYYKRGKIETAAEHRPDYLKKSQAEREWEKKHAD